jgi:hypothetical protein
MVNESVTSTATTEVRRHLNELRTERALAIESGLGAVGIYMSDLEREIETWRRLYVVAAVTEIAIRRSNPIGG